MTDNLERGVIYCVYGKAWQLVDEAIASLHQFNPDMPYRIVSDESKGDHLVILFEDKQKLARQAKTNLEKLSPFKHTLYLDIDMLIQQPIDTYFTQLDQGYDMAIAMSQQQGDRWCWHITEDEREFTLNEIGMRPIQFQAGAFSFKKSPKIRAFFAEWRRQWTIYQGHDQAALTRALRAKQIRLSVLGRAFNNGAVIKHDFGAIGRLTDE